MKKIPEVIKDITFLLSTIFSEIESNNQQGLNDKSVFGELLMRLILNDIMNWDLININARQGKSNVAGIDLIDDEHKIAIQVTARDDKAKMKDMIEKVSKQTYLSKYHIYFCCLKMDGNKLKRAKLNKNGKVIFDNKKDIIDGNKIINDIKEKPFEEIRYLGTKLRDYLGLEDYDPVKIKQMIEQQDQPWQYSVPENYIERIFCCESIDIQRETDDIISKLFHPTYHPTGRLIDFVCQNIEQAKSKHYIIYSSAQSGKTTELYHLGKELKDNKLCPVFIKAADYDKTHQGRFLQIPLNFYEKDIILMIDGFDEVSDNNRDALHEEIVKIQEKFPEIRIIVTCRENFKMNKQFEGYIQLTLQDLTINEISSFIKNSLSEIEAKRVTNSIETKRLYSFVCIPFYLKALIEYYKKNHHCPNLRKELYDFWIDKAFNIDDKSITDPVNLQSKVKSRLLRIAMVLQITESQDITQADILTVLTEPELNECFHLSLFKRKDDRCYFEHNAFKEYYAASYISKLPLEEVKKFVCYNNDPGGKICKSWYNTLLLALSMKEKGKEYDDLLNWIMKDNIEIMINIDPFSISDSVKLDILKRILDDYKIKNTYVPDSYNKNFNISQLCNIFETEEYLIKEFENYHKLDPYLSTLERIIQWMDFDSLEDVGLDKRYDNAIFERIKELGNTNTEDTLMLYVAFRNKHFKQCKYIDKLISLHISSIGQRCLSCIYELIKDTDTADKYLDFILKSEHLLQEFRLHNAICMVNREIIYNLIASIHEPASVKLFWNLLGHLLDERKHYYSSTEKKDIELMIQHLLELSKEIMLEDSDIKHDIEKFWKQVYIKEHSGYKYISNIHADFQKIFNCNYNLGNIIEERNLLRTLVRNNCQYNNQLKLFRCHIAMHATMKDIDVLFDNLQKNQADYIISTYYRTSISKEWDKAVEKNIRKLWPIRYPNCEKQQMDKLDRLLKYTFYKKHIKEIIKSIRSKNSMSYKIKVRESTEYKWDQYDYNFLQLAYDADTKEYDLRFDKKLIENQNKYEYFVLDQIKTEYNSQNYTEPQIKIINKYIQHLIALNPPEERLRKLLSAAITFDTNLPEDRLIKCIPFASCRDYKTHYLDKSGYLLEYIERHIDIDKVLNEIPQYIKKGIKNSNDIYYLIQELFKHNQLAARIKLMDILDIINDPNMILHIQICEMIEKGYENVKHCYKAYFDHAKAELKLHFAWYLFKNKDNYQWLRNKFSEYRSDLMNHNKEYTQSFLLALGDEQALNELLEEIKTQKIDYRTRHFILNYSDIRFLPQMKELLNIGMTQNENSYSELRDSVIDSMELMAMTSTQNMNTICTYLNSIMKPGTNNYLYNIIAQIKNKYYEEHSTRISIKEAVKLIS